MKTTYKTRLEKAKKEFSAAQTIEEIKKAFENLKRAYNNLKAAS